MEDLNQQINQFLSDPQSMQQLQNMAAALGLGGSAATVPQAPAPAAGPELSPLAGALGALGLGGNPAPGVSPEILQLVTRLGPLLSQVSREDDSTRLLQALRPLLGAARQKKLDEAVKILQMMRLLPLLRESGLFGQLSPL